MINRYQQYFCEFKVKGGGAIRVPYNEIRKIVIDTEFAVNSKLYLKNEQVPISISNNPEQIREQTQQLETL